jgi:hypothetical protein
MDQTLASGNISSLGVSSTCQCQRDCVNSTNFGMHGGENNLDNRAYTWVRNDPRIALWTLQRASQRDDPRRALSCKLCTHAREIQAGLRGPPHKLQKDKILNTPPSLERQLRVRDDCSQPSFEHGSVLREDPDYASHLAN